MPQHLGLPRDKAHAINLLKACNGMRNIIVHRYRIVELEKLVTVVENDLITIIETARTLARSEHPSLLV